jgi:hypothetical protein
MPGRNPPVALLTGGSTRWRTKDSQPPNALNPPYTIRVSGADKAGPEAQNMMRLLVSLIDESGASDRGGDLEVVILVEN